MATSAIDKDIIPVPTFSAAGWVSSKQKKADYLLAHFLEAQYSQSMIYQGRVSSLQWIIAQNAQDIEKTKRLLQETFEDYLSAYYETASVEVTSDADEPDSTVAKVTLRMSATVTEKNGSPTSFVAMISIEDSKVSNFIRLNNSGSL
jgi:hypothetical protein